MAAWIAEIKPVSEECHRRPKRIEICGAITGAIYAARWSGHGHLLARIRPTFRIMCARSATRKPWCERPSPCDIRVTLRRRHRGRSHHGLLSDNRRRGLQAGGRVRRPSWRCSCEVAGPLRVRIDFRQCSRAQQRGDCWNPENGSGQPTRSLGCLARNRSQRARRPCRRAE